MTKTDWPREPLEADTVEMLHGILSTWCDQFGCAMGSEEGQLTAKMLVDWFEFGIHDERELTRIVRDKAMRDLKTPE